MQIPFGGSDVCGIPETRLQLLGLYLKLLENAIGMVISSFGGLDLRGDNSVINGNLHTVLGSIDFTGHMVLPALLSRGQECGSALLNLVRACMQ